MMLINQEQTKYGWQFPDPLLHHAYILPKIIKLLPDGVEKIIDAGCGNGYIAAYLASLNYEVVGIDISSDGIDIARKAYSNCRFETRSVYADLSDLMDDVDVVISSEVIEHLYSPQTFIKNMFSVVRPGGYLILTTPYHGYLKNLALSITNQWDKHHTVDWEGGHIKFFSERTIKLLLEEAGFGEIIYSNAGRLPWLWKSMVCRVQKPPTQTK